MADGTPIEWTDATVNAVSGCSVISPGCTNCYAMRAGGRNLPAHPSTGLTKPSRAGHVWTGEVRLNERALLQPLRWRRPRRIFWNAHGDLFHDNVPDEWIDRVLAVCALTPQHQHQILTKRSARMRAYFDRAASHEKQARIGGIAAELNDGKWRPIRFPLPHIWLGVSVEDQARADERIPDLLATPAAVRFLSCEPLLGPVDLETVHGLNPTPEWDYVALNALTGSGYFVEDDGNYGADPCTFGKLDWVIVGGESGPGARPMHPDWARSLRDQCSDADVPFFFKQWGEWRPPVQPECFDTSRGLAGKPPAFNVRGDDGTVHCFLDTAGSDPAVMLAVGKKAAGRRLDGAEHSGMPA